MSETIVRVKDLTKTYGNMSAVNKVSFTLEEGKIYGLLGRNGAGKTTIMNMLTAQSFATSGEIKLFGEEPYENINVLNKVCFIKESQKYPDIYQVRHVMKTAASLYPNWDQSLADELIEIFRLPPKRHMKKLSRGMLSSVGIVVGLASRAPLTIFDEPYLGLDAVARSLFYDKLIEDYTAFPRTIVLSTHLIDEVNRLLEHIIVIDNGSIIIDEDADALRNQAFTVVGHQAKVKKFVENKRVILEEAFGSLLKMTVHAALSERERQQAGELGLELAAVSMQQLIVQLTKDEQPKKAVIH